MGSRSRVRRARVTPRALASCWRRASTARKFSTTLFNNNNYGTLSGRGIYTNGAIAGDNLTNVTIDGNAFFKNYGAANITTGLEGSIAFEALNVGKQSNIRITNNIWESNGKNVLAY